MPFERPVPCGGGPFPSREAGRPALLIGSVGFRGLGEPQPAQRFAPGAPPLTVEAIVPPRSRVTIAVPPDQRRVAGVDGFPARAGSAERAHRAVRCLTGSSTQVFQVSFIVAGARCVPVAVTIDRVTTTREVPFGVTRCRR